MAVAPLILKNSKRECKAQHHEYTLLFMHVRSYDESLMPPAAEMATALFWSIDTDFDGIVTNDELKDGMLKLRGGMKRDDIEAIVRSLPQEITLKKMERIIEEMDQMEQHDGHVHVEGGASLNEYEAALMPHQHTSKDDELGLLGDAHKVKKPSK